MMSIAKFETVKVKRNVVKLVLSMVKDNEFYKRSEVNKEGLLRETIQFICEEYEIEPPMFRVDTSNYNHYQPSNKLIVCENTSVISMLHELRHHLQHVAGKQYPNMTIEEDARAWSLRVFSRACPKSFEKSVKAGKVNHVKWDEELGKVIDDARYV